MKHVSIVDTFNFRLQNNTVSRQIPFLRTYVNNWIHQYIPFEGKTGNFDWISCRSNQSGCKDKMRRGAICNFFIVRWQRLFERNKRYKKFWTFEKIKRCQKYRTINLCWLNYWNGKHRIQATASYEAIFFKRDLEKPTARQKTDT